MPKFIWAQLILKVKTAHHPELEEVLKHCWCDEDAVDHGVRQEQQKELIVGESNTVVYPKEYRRQKHRISNISDHSNYNIVAYEIHI